MGFLGFKQLFLHPGGFITSPLHKRCVWEKDKNLAAFHSYTWSDTIEFNDDPSKIHCDLCGFHSFKRPEFMEDYGRSYLAKSLAVPAVWCVVDNNGFVVEHELGYRASHSKLLFYTRNRRELLEWCTDQLSDHMPEELIKWCQAEDKSEWKMYGDHFDVTKNYIVNWLENGRDAYLRIPTVEEYQADAIPRGWGKPI